MSLTTDYHLPYNPFKVFVIRNHFLSGRLFLRSAGRAVCLLLLCLLLAHPLFHARNAEHAPSSCGHSSSMDCPLCIPFVASSAQTLVVSARLITTASPPPSYRSPAPGLLVRPRDRAPPVREPI